MPAAPVANRTKLYAGDQLDAGAARRLVEEVESAWADLRHQRVEFATKATDALEKRLAAVAAYNVAAARPAGMPRRGRSWRN